MFLPVFPMFLSLYFHLVHISAPLSCVLGHGAWYSIRTVGQNGHSVNSHPCTCLTTIDHLLCGYTPSFSPNLIYGISSARPLPPSFPLLSLCPCPSNPVPLPVPFPSHVNTVPFVDFPSPQIPATYHVHASSLSSSFSRRSASQGWQANCAQGSSIACWCWSTCNPSRRRTCHAHWQ